MCDVLIGSDEARFADTHGRVGILPGWGLTVRLSPAVGLARAHRMGLTGNYLDAHTALRLGLLSEVVEPAVLVGTAVAPARKIAANEERSVAGYLDRFHTPGAIGARRDAVVARGRAQAGTGSPS
jgi:enoyl-CoA hydratase